MGRRKIKDTLENTLARIFEKSAASEASWFLLPGGGRLFSAGEEAETLYLLRAGRLGVFRKEEGRETQFLGMVTPGEPVGEMSLVAGTPHTATVVALRDSEILALPRDAFFRAARDYPEVMTELARLMIRRAREPQGGRLAEPTVFGFLGLSDRPIRPFVDLVEAEVAALGFSVKVVDSRALKSATEWFSAIEQTHDYVLYTAEKSEESWAQLCARQVDRLFLVGRAADRPPSRSWWNADALEEQRLIDLILLRRPSLDHPRGTKPWLDAVDPARWFHVRGGYRPDAARIARVIAGCSVGLVLSGGGARAFAHVGAIQALREARTPIDFLGGASMGATIAAGLALGWDQEEMDRRMRKAFVETSPLDDIAFPVLAMTRGHKVDDRLEEHFGDILIEDLATPFFAVSSNLTTGSYHVHKRGPLRRALRASIALPGILPPVIAENSVLVDGAVMRSFPADVMRAWHQGTVVGVDVTRARGIDPKQLENPPSWWKWLLSGDWRRGPPIVSIMMRSATITHAGELAAGRAATDLLVIPKPDGVEIRDWRAYDPAVTAGYYAMVEALAQLEGPVTMLRRRQLSYQPAEPIITLDDIEETDAGKAAASPRPAPSETADADARDRRRERRTAERRRAVRDKA